MDHRPSSCLPSTMAARQHESSDVRMSTARAIELRARRSPRSISFECATMERASAIGQSPDCLISAPLFPMDGIASDPLAMDDVTAGSFGFLQAKIDELAIVIKEKEDNESSLRRRIKLLEDEDRNCLDAMGRLRCELAAQQLKCADALQMLDKERITVANLEDRLSSMEVERMSEEDQKSTLQRKMTGLTCANKALRRSATQMFSLMQRMGDCFTDQSTSNDKVISTANEINHLLNEWRTVSRDSDQRKFSSSHNVRALQDVVDETLAELASCQSALKTSLADSQHHSEVVDLLSSSVDALRGNSATKDDLVEQLRSALENATSEMACRVEDIAHLRQTNEQMSARLEKYRINELGVSNIEARLTKEIDDEKEKTTASISDCHLLRCRLLAAEEAAVAMRRECDALTVEVQRLTSGLETAHSALEIAEKRLEETRRQTTAFADTEDTLLMRWQQLKTEQQNSLRDHEDLTERHATSQAQLQTANNACREKQNEIKELKAALEKWRSLHHDEVSRARSSTEEVGDSKVSLESSRVDLWDEKRKSSECQLKLEYTLGELMSAKQLIVEMKAAAGASQTEASGLRETKAKLCSEIEVMRTKVVCLEDAKATQIEKYETERKQTSVVLAGKEDAAALLRSQWEAVKAESRYQCQVINTMKEQQRNQQSEVKRRTDEYEAMVTGLRCQVNELRGELEVEAGEHRHTRLALDGSRSDVTTKEEAMAHLHAEVDNLSAEVKRKSCETEALETVICSLETSVAQCKTEMAATQEKWQASASEILEGFLEAAS